MTAVWGRIMEFNRKKGGLYRNLNVSVKLLDAVIIGGLTVIACIIFASV